MHWIYTIGFLVILFGVSLFAQQLLLKKALIQVIAIFEENRATTPETARTLEELNLQPPGFLKRAAAFRDYKHRVVDSLLKAGIVMVTEEGKYYLSKSELSQSPIPEMLNTSDGA